MMKQFKYLAILLINLCMAGVFCACGGDDDDDDYAYPNNEESGHSSHNVSRPSISVLTATSTTTEFTVVFEVRSEEEPSSVTLHYGRNSSSTSSPTINKSSSCRLQRKANNTYYYSKTHAGFTGGNYIYFYGEVTNSAGTSKSQTSHVIIKRM